MLIKLHHPGTETIRIPDDALAEWFRTALQVTFRDIGDVQREQRIAQKKRLAEIEAMQERLLNPYFAGTIDEATLASRQTQLRDESAAQIWRGSKMDQKREILESVSLNRMLGDVTLVVEKRKPFDKLAKRLLVTSSRDDWRSFEPWTNARRAYVESFTGPRQRHLSEMSLLIRDMS